jgi:hypothetical protein
MKQIRRRTCPFFLIVCLASLFIPIAQANAAADTWPNLLTRTKLLAEASGQGEVWGTMGPVGLWLGDHALLLPNASNRYPQAGRVILDVGTGIERPATGLGITNSGTLMSTSPNGQWVLWSNRVGNAPFGKPTVTRVDGTRTVAWKAMFSGLDSGWLSDSNRFASVGYVPGGISPYTHRRFDGPGINIYNVQTGRSVAIAVPNLPNNYQTICCDRSGNLVMTASSGFYVRSQPTVEIDRLNLHSSNPVVTMTTIPIPQDPGANDGNFYVSPHGTRILWRFNVYTASQISTSSSLFPRSMRATNMAIDYFVSNIDGTSLRKVGRLTGSYSPWPTAWSPSDDKVALMINQQVGIVSLP